MAYLQLYFSARCLLFLKNRSCRRYLSVIKYTLLLFIDIYQYAFHVPIKVEEMHVSLCLHKERQIINFVYQVVCFLWTSQPLTSGTLWHTRSWVVPVLYYFLHLEAVFYSFILSIAGICFDSSSTPKIHVFGFPLDHSPLSIFVFVFLEKLNSEVSRLASSPSVVDPFNVSSWILLLARTQAGDTPQRLKE